MKLDPDSCRKQYAISMTTSHIHQVQQNCWTILKLWAGPEQALAHMISNCQMVTDGDAQLSLVIGNLKGGLVSYFPFLYLVACSKCMKTLRESNVACWKIHHLHLILPLKPPLIGDFPLPRLITRGCSCYGATCNEFWLMTMMPSNWLQWLAGSATFGFLLGSSPDRRLSRKKRFFELWKEHPFKRWTK